MKFRIDRKSSSRRFLAWISILAILMLGALMVSIGHASAGDFNKVVQGHVYQGDTSHPVEGASVVVKILYSDRNERYVFPTTLTTNSAGFYTCTISASNWDLTNIIQVTATKAPDQKTSELTITKLAQQQPIETIDVIFDYAIPQFASAAGALFAACLVGVVAVVFIRRKKPFQ
jgi:hypothetical protein